MFLKHVLDLCLFSKVPGPWARSYQKWYETDDGSTIAGAVPRAGAAHVDDGLTTGHIYIYICRYTDVDWTILSSFCLTPFLASYWDHFGIILGLFWDPVGMVLGSFVYDVCIILA